MKLLNILNYKYLKLLLNFQISIKIYLIRKYKKIYIIENY